MLKQELMRFNWLYLNPFDPLEQSSGQPGKASRCRGAVSSVSKAADPYHHVPANIKISEWV